MPLVRHHSVALCLRLYSNLLCQVVEARRVVAPSLQVAGAAGSWSQNRLRPGGELEGSISRMRSRRFSIPGHAAEDGEAESLELGDIVYRRVEILEQESQGQAGSQTEQHAQR